MSDASGGGSRFDEHENDVQIPTFACPKCGQSLPVGTPICGNCGTILQGGTHVPEPLAARGFKPAAVMVFALVVALGIAGFVARDDIAELFETTTVELDGGADRAIPETSKKKQPGGGGRGGGQSGRIEGPRSTGQIVRRIRAAGIPCASAKVDSSDGYVETGSCQSNGQHVQINLYFRPESFRFAEDFYDDWAFATVHDDNWWISGDTALMHRIHAALGGRFTPPS